MTDDDGLFTWVLVDVDAPDPADPSHAPFLHYIVSDIRAAKGGDEQQSPTAGRVLVPYYPVTPPVGVHRYVSLLFRQRKNGGATREDDDEQLARLSEQRANFNVAAFADDRELVLARSAHFYSEPVGGKRRLR